MKQVFVCSPYAGDIPRNTARAKALCLREIRAGNAPFAPHILYPEIGLDEDVPGDRECGIAAGIAFLSSCDELVMERGQVPSRGMAAEIRLAKRWGIPIRKVEPVAEPTSLETVSLDEQRVIKMVARYMAGYYGGRQCNTLPKSACPAYRTCEQERFVAGEHSQRCEEVPSACRRYIAEALARQLNHEKMNGCCGCLHNKDIDAGAYSTRSPECWTCHSGSNFESAFDAQLDSAGGEGR